jgi:hypothetical protein
MLERIFLPKTETIDQLRGSLEKILNGIIARYNREENVLLGVLDANQNRIVNLGRPVRGADAVPLSYLREVLGKRQETKIIQLGESSVLVGVHADRPASGVLGSLYYETDRSTLYVGDGSDWVFAGGQMRGTLDPNQKPTDLNSGGDVGFLFFSTDFHHEYRWDGSDWEWSHPGDPSGRISLFAVAPGDGWKLLDGGGNPFTYSTAVGGTTTISVDALNSGSTFIKFSAFSGTVDAAVPPTGTTDAVASGGSVNFGAGVNVEGGTGATPCGVTGSVSVTGTTHDHPITMNPDGAPESFGVLPYFRL